MRISGMVGRCRVLGDVRLHVAHLDRAGVRTQQDVGGDLSGFVVQIESVCIERAGWSSGVLSAVKFWKSASISGPSTTSKPIERNKASMRSSVRVTGCSPPRTSLRPGRVTSSDIRQPGFERLAADCLAARS